MDALPIQDKKKVAYASKIPGVMHACGHDGHVAMLLGAAALLQKRELPGRISLIFQPAEEHGNGAEKIIKEGALQGIDAIFAGHIDIHYPTGTMTIDEGVICSSADPFLLRVLAKAGMPPVRMKRGMPLSPGRIWSPPCRPWYQGKPTRTSRQW